jgi:hypothetical protein
MIVDVLTPVGGFDSKHIHPRRHPPTVIVRAVPHYLDEARVLDSADELSYLPPTGANDRHPHGGLGRGTEYDTVVVSPNEVRCSPCTLSPCRLVLQSRSNTRVRVAERPIALEGLRTRSTRSRWCGGSRGPGSRRPGNRDWDRSACPPIPAPDPPSPGLLSADGSPVLPVPCVSVTHPFHQSAVFQPCEIRSENVTLTKHGFKSRRIAPILLTDQRARGPRARSRARRFCRVARHWDGSGGRIPVRDPAAHDFSASNARARYRWCRRATLGTSGPGTLRPRGAEQGARPFASAPGASMCWWATVETLMLIQRHLP